MEPFDPLINSLPVSGWKPLLTLALFASIGAFFFGALVTALLQSKSDQSDFEDKKKDN